MADVTGQHLADLVAEAFSEADPEFEEMLISLIEWRLIWRRRSMFHHWRRQFVHHIGGRLAILREARPMIQFMAREARAVSDAQPPQ